MKDIKILEFIDTYYPTVDGAINVANFYTEKLNERAEAKIVVPKASKRQKYQDNKPFEVIRCLSMPAPEGYRNGLPFLDCKFKKKIKSEDVDIIHTHSPFLMGRFALKTAKKKKIPIVATLHTQYHRDFERTLKGFKPFVKFMMHFIMKTFNNVDSVWTVSEASCNILRSYGYKGNIEVVRNATDMVYPKNDKELIKKVNGLHNLEGQKNVFIFVGRLAWYKNLKIIIDGLKILKDKNKDFKMLFVGGGFDEKEVKEYVLKKGLENDCIFTGNVSDKELIQGYYLRSDLMVFPSTFDMATVTKEEASVHKKAVLAVKGSCTAEEIKDGYNGFLCEENAQSLAEKLERIMGTDLMKIAGENACKTLYRNWDMVADEVMEKYKKIIKEYKEKNK